MAEFGDNFDQDPAAEFLQREQNALAGLEDDIPQIPAGNLIDFFDTRKIVFLFHYKLLFT